MIRAWLARLLRSGALGLLLLLGALTGAYAHALEPGYGDLRQISSADSWQVFWRKPTVNGKPMAIDLALPETCTPATGPEPHFDGAAWVSSWIAACPDGLAGTMVSIPGLSAQRTDVLIRVQPFEAPASTLRLTPETPAQMVPHIQSTLDVLLAYGWLGFEHILEGWDHLLFVLALLILIRDPWRLTGAITAFTVAHSITLALAALGHVSVPGPPVEAAIALSIVFLAVEILKRRPDAPRLSERAPWIVSFSFGLLHGLGFAGALREIGLPEGDIPAALLAFNLGVEAGQLAFVGGVLVAITLARPIWSWLAARRARLTSALQPALGYGCGAIATFWLVERMMAF